MIIREFLPTPAVDRETPSMECNVLPIWILLNTTAHA
jgi:hypothetical protein